MVKIDGFSLSVFKLNLTKFDGYGFTILNITTDIFKNITISKGGSLFHLSFRKHHEYKGIMWKIHLNFLFYFQLHKTIKTIKESENYCMDCKEYFTHKPFIEIQSPYQKGHIHKYCSEECYKYSYDFKK